MSDTTAPTRSAHLYPVVVIGGGLGGSAAAAFLASAGHPVVVLERHDEPTARPRAWVVSARSMELFRSIGVDDQVRSRGTAGGWDLQTVDTLQDVPAGRVSADDDTPDEEIGSAGTSMCDQDVLEDILRSHASRHGADIRFGHAVESMADRGDQVEIRIEGVEASLRARYVILADGARAGLLPDIGVASTTPADSDFDPFFQILFRSTKLDRIMADKPGKAFFCPPSNTIVFRRDLGRWQLQRQSEDFDDAQAAVDAAVGRHVDIDVLDHGSWTPRGSLADRFRSGNVFLLGDTAHAMPPSLGMAGNLAVADAHNLAWKLSWVLTGRAHEALLDSYELERRPVDEFVLHQSLAAMRYEPTADHLSIDLGLGYPAGTSPALLGDGTGITVEDPRENRLVVGGRVPNVRTRDGRLVHDLVGSDHFVTLTSGDVDAFDSEVPVVSAELVDGGCDDDRIWLVRPDGHIAAHASPTDISAILKGLRGGPRADHEGQNDSRRS